MNLTWYLPFIVLLVVNSCYLLPRSRKNPLDKSSLPLIVVNTLYIKGVMGARLISSNCFPEYFVTLNLLNEAIEPKLTSLISLALAYLLLSAFFDNLKV